MLGRASGRHLHALAHNRDPRPVQVGRRRRSIGSQRALGRSPKTADAIDAVVVGLVDRVTRRMRAAGRVGRTVVLRLRFDDFSRATRSHTLSRATAQTHTILATVRALLATAMPMIERQGLTLVGVVGRQPRRRRRRPARAAVRPAPAARALDAALDDVRDRFGSSAVTRAVLLGRDQGLSVPMLPGLNSDLATPTSGVTSTAPTTPAAAPPTSTRDHRHERRDVNGLADDHAAG